MSQIHICFPPEQLPQLKGISLSPDGKTLTWQGKEYTPKRHYHTFTTPTFDSYADILAKAGSLVECSTHPGCWELMYRDMHYTMDSEGDRVSVISFAPDGTPVWNIYIGE